MAYDAVPPTYNDLWGKINSLEARLAERERELADEKERAGGNFASYERVKEQLSKAHSELTEAQAALSAATIRGNNRLVRIDELEQQVRELTAERDRLKLELGRLRHGSRIRTMIEDATTDLRQQLSEAHQHEEQTHAEMEKLVGNSDSFVALTRQMKANLQQAQQREAAAFNEGVAAAAKCAKDLFDSTTDGELDRFSPQEWNDVLVAHIRMLKCSEPVSGGRVYITLCQHGCAPAESCAICREQPVSGEGEDNNDPN